MSKQPSLPVELGLELALDWPRRGRHSGHMLRLDEEGPEQRRSGPARVEMVAIIGTFTSFPSCGANQMSGKTHKQWCRPMVQRCRWPSLIGIHLWKMKRIRKTLPYAGIKWRNDREKGGRAVYR